jgi:hypothetical protein
MLTYTSVNTNENLVNIIFAYLNVKDLATVSSVCKTFHKMSKGYNNYWRECCINFFSSKGEQHRYYIRLFDSIFKTKDYLIDEDNEYKNDLEWKRFFKTGLSIKQNWVNLALDKKHVVPNYSEDVTSIYNELYMILKGKSIFLNDGIIYL